MLFWAGIALLQVLALPGYVVTRALRLDEGSPVQTAVLSFGLSLVVNHFLVVLLVLGGGYARPVLAGVVAVECALAAWLWRRGGGGKPSLARRTLAYLQGSGEADGESDGSTGRLWLLLAALFALGYLLSFVPHSFTHVFKYWDAIVSWNGWAADWEASRLPAYTMHYPQLVPTNWSLLYVLQGAPLQFLSHGIMSLFPVGIAAIFIDLGLRRGGGAFILAAVVVTALMATSVGRYIGSGLVDIPVSFFGLLAFYPLLWGEFGAEPRRDAARLAASALAAIGCAHTKQAGLYVVAVLPVFVWIFLRRWPARARLTAVGAVLGILLVGVGPWYGYVELRIAQGLDGSEIITVTHDAHLGLGLFARARRALALWERVLPASLLYPGIGLILVSILRPAARWITLLVSLPFALLWAFYFSYDFRNLALGLPFLALSAGHGAIWVADGFARLWAARRRAAAIGLSSAAAAVALWALTAADPLGIFAASDRQLREVGKTELNRQILNYHQTHGFEGLILTNYRILINFPELREFVFVNRGATGDDFWPFLGGAETFARVVENPAHGIRFILLERPVKLDITRYIQKRIKAGHYEVVFSIPQGRLLRIVPRG